ncbi:MULTISPECIES: mycofactocin oligosaccharide methyltransferase MftM [unclassified Gordonia (in: high G+C Gram-positive bacteria)]|uniref:mycofactocin oligosaccharide methyltransferase MftM n=1 Tax=unclassified Gordonia (in: high G+C Gram-positive bacteria) TaxID=2657482 RepID=UPI0009AEF490|nr:MULTISPECIES: mycofactocin oligosaccharide methyltransferase MftM [unclassified Gordonia (in: high G+C Gram-positive bacteria)]MDF3285261.1 mycofactocin oligosaccharide methyltransferase MftM [Gordonia sp. N1V]OPX15983.1 SAM-dependent methyltransferase [Gordonia sp. i37]
MVMSVTTMSAGLPTTRRITVRHVDALPADLPHAGRVAWSIDRDGGRVELVHTFTVAEISDDAMVLALEGVIDAGALCGQWEFEEAAVGLIRSCSERADDAWAGFYDNSLRALRDGTASFAPVHRRARSLISGSSVLEVGCCFGFFALRCAEDGLDVAACDISFGAVDLLTQAARRRDTPVLATVGDATDLDHADSSVDTVTLIHLLEHLPADQARAAIIEALRVARRRVVIAIPYEDRPSEHFGHLVRLGPENLHAWADAADHAGAEFLTDHGGWLVLTPRR